MTRTKFIMKWLGTNKPYDQHHRDEMLDDLDKVIAYAKQVVKNCNTPAVSKSVCTFPIPCNHDWDSEFCKTRCSFRK